jgi:hypothetical protein
MTVAISLSQRVTVPQETLIRVIDGESVLLNLKNEMYYGLDGVGTRFWEHLSASPTISAACDRLAEEFDAPVETIRSDMRVFVETLAQRGLIAVAGE